MDSMDRAVSSAVEKARKDLTDYLMNRLRQREKAEMLWVKPIGAVEWHGWWPHSETTLCGSRFPKVEVQVEPRGPVCSDCEVQVERVRAEVDALIEGSKAE